MSTPDMYFNKDGTLCVNIRYPHSRPERASPLATGAILTHHVGKVLAKHQQNTQQILSAAQSIRPNKALLHVNLPPMPLPPPPLAQSAKLQTLLSQYKPPKLSLSNMLKDVQFDTPAPYVSRFSEDSDSDADDDLDSATRNERRLAQQFLFLKCFLGEDAPETMTCQRIAAPEVNPCLFSAEAVVAAAVESSLEGLLISAITTKNIPATVTGTVAYGIVGLIKEYAKETKRVGDCEKQESENVRP